MLGAINIYIEHHKCNVIMIAHDDKIEGFLSDMKEKIIGHIIRVNPNISDALERFISGHRDEEYRKFLLTYKDTLVSTLLTRD